MSTPGSMSTPQSYPARLAEAAARAAAEAARQWERAATKPGRGGRIVTAATLAWNAAYPLAYAHGYTMLAVRAGAAFEDLHDHLDAAQRPQRAAVRRLVEAAREVRPRHEAMGPPRRVLGIAALAALDRRDGQTAAEAITEAVHREAVMEGGIHGALSAAEDIRSDWRSRTDSAVRAVQVGSLTLAERVDAALAEANRDFVTDWVASAGRRGSTPAEVARASFAVPVTAPTRPADLPTAGRPTAGPASARPGEANTPHRRHR